MAPSTARRARPDGLVNRSMQEILNHLEWSRFERSSPDIGLQNSSGDTNGTGNRLHHSGMNRPSAKYGSDSTSFNFWPTALAMGSLVGRQFLQVG
jgi:hypothetical protein